MSKIYIQAASEIGLILKLVEQYLVGLDDNVVVKPEHIQRKMPDRFPSMTEIYAALEALSFVGILEECDQGYRFFRSKLEESAGYREAVFQVLEFVQETKVDSPSLCGTIPPGLSENLSDTFREELLDLPSAISELIGTANERLVLASPFWDTRTAQEVGELLTKRLAAGIQVDILGRFESRNDKSVATLLSVLNGHPYCKMYRWFEADSEDPFGTQTFHFKSIVADSGKRAYLGSANLTTAGMRSRMELGCILGGEQARSLAAIMDEVLFLSQRIVG